MSWAIWDSLLAGNSQMAIPEKTALYRMNHALPIACRHLVGMQAHSWNIHAPASLSTPRNHIPQGVRAIHNISLAGKYGEYCSLLPHASLQFHLQDTDQGPVAALHTHRSFLDVLPHERAERRYCRSAEAVTRGLSRFCRV